MKIALDYDNTYTLDPDCWYNVIIEFLSSDHEVSIVTVRHEYWDAHPWLDDLKEEFEIPVIFTDGRAKKDFCLERGIEFDVWIDDRPQTITQNSTWSHESPDLRQWRIDNYAKLIADGYPEYARNIDEYTEKNKW